MIHRLNDVLYRIDSELDGRHLFQFVVVDAGKALLVDTGVNVTPEAVIIPALAEIGIGPNDLEIIVVTHTDLDHQGGIAPLREQFPNAAVACGFDDVPHIEDPALLVSDRYGRYELGHGLAFGADDLVDIRAAAGPNVHVDLGLIGGEIFTLGAQTLRIRHLPGHSAGHLGVEVVSTGDLVLGDAIQGRFCPAVDGRPAIPPTYTDVDSYLGTIATVERIAPNAVHGGHDDTYVGADVTRFLRESREFVDDVETLLQQMLVEPHTLRQLCDLAQERFGPYDTPSFNFVFAIHGHVRRSLRRGELHVVDPRAQRLQWVR